MEFLDEKKKTNYVVSERVFVIENVSARVVVVDKITNDKLETGNV